jgi:hypothetical protein
MRRYVWSKRRSIDKKKEERPDRRTRQERKEVREGRRNGDRKGRQDRTG